MILLRADVTARLICNWTTRDLRLRTMCTAALCVMGRPWNERLKFSLRTTEGACRRTKGGNELRNIKSHREIELRQHLSEQASFETGLSDSAADMVVDWRRHWDHHQDHGLSRRTTQQVHDVVLSHGQIAPLIPVCLSFEYAHTLLLVA